MKRAAFLCSRCGAELTDLLKEVGEGKLSLETSRPAVPGGHFVRLTRSWSYRQFVTALQPGHRYGSPDGDLVAFDAGDYLLNVADVRHQIAEGAVHGCCGWHPRGEANALCANGHEVGTVHSDECWSAMVFRLIGRDVDEVAT